MSFANPEVFFLLLFLPLAALRLFQSYRKGRVELQKIGGLWRGHRLDSIYLLKSFFSGSFLILSFFFLIVALSGPAWGTAPVEESQEGLDVAVTLDISRSMLAQDVKPNRLVQAKEGIKQLLQAFPSARFSLVVFKGGALTLVPLTPDTVLLERTLADTGPDSFKMTPGTNLESALREALRSLDYPTSRHKVAVLFSDGEGRDGDLVAASRSLLKSGLKVFCFGVGTPEGATVPNGEGALTDDFGFTVQSRLNEGALRTAAQETGGRYYPDISRASLRDLQGQMTSLANPASRGGVRLEPVQRFRFFLFLALAGLFGFVMIRIIPWKGIF